MDPKELTLKIAKILDDNKATNIVILDVSQHIFITDYFIICCGMTERHVQALADKVEAELKKDKVKSFGKEGYNEGKWVLLDYIDAVVHIYQEEVRRYYDLEDLWADAPRVEMNSGVVK